MGEVSPKSGEVFSRVNQPMKLNLISWIKINKN